jgi:demethylmenaquinone methyltransferase/2-methoxy-6-polyprenyl-1,4-benzoquinol methylase
MEINKDKELIKGIFDRIATRYDFLNHFLSFGIDKIWRRKAVLLLKKSQNPDASIEVLDVASGTGDLAISIAKNTNWSVLGIDLSNEMLKIAKNKAIKNELSSRVQFKQCDALDSKIPDKSFDCITVAFGVRNFSNLGNGLDEFHRILKDNGKILVLEFSWSKSIFLKMIMSVVVPFIGLLFGNYNSYKYLADSGNKFPSSKMFIKVLENHGFKSVLVKSLTLGIASIYFAKKIVY